MSEQLCLTFSAFFRHAQRNSGCVENEKKINVGYVHTSLSSPAATVMIPPVLLLMVNMLEVGLSGF